MITLKQTIKELPSLLDLESHFNIDPTSPSGLRWLKPVRPGRVKPGDIAGKQDKDKSWGVRFKTKRYRVHRIIFYMANKEDPGEFLIDHIDLNPGNNCINNLRKATNADNQRNTRKIQNKTSIYKGVSLFKKTNKWKCGIYFNRKQIHLGYFNSEIEAAKRYDIEALKFFGEFACTNFN